ncbi:MAG: DUF2268 domain-containing protein [bacterium]|nr:DUF2268 domain-containing protein [bacterium]
MKIEYVNSSEIYRKIQLADENKKDDIYRYELMMPFKGKWDCYHIPIKAPKEGAYDIIMASQMLGHLIPGNMDESCNEWIDAISDSKLWSDCTRVIRQALERFVDAGVELKVDRYLYSILLADPTSPYIIMSEGYSGDGGIPGYIMGWLVPNENTKRRLPAALVHETNHNVRYQHIQWKSDITLGEMIVSEGLAENYATTLFGEDYLGPWVTKTDMELMPLIKEIIYDGLGAQGLENINAYLYGDEMARMQHFPEVGLPYCAGYAVGYYLVKYFLTKTKVPIEQATIMPAEDILSQVKEFWTEEV